MPFKTICFLLTLTVSLAVGQQPPARGEIPRHSRALNYGNWVGRQVLTKEFIEQVGIKREQEEKLKREFAKLEAQSRTLDESINQAALEQAKVAKKVLAEPGANVDDVMKIIERIGKLRTEQAKITTQVLVVIRDNLTDEQRVKANEIIAAEGEKRMQDRAGRREREERNGPKPQRPDVPKGW